MIRNSFLFPVTVTLVLLCLPSRSFGIPLDCSSTQYISGSTTLGSDYATTSTVPCFSLSAGVNLNLGGHQIICNNANGCSTAIVRTGTGTTVRNGFIVSGTGDWAIGIDHPGTVQNVTIENANVAVFRPLTRVENSVFKNIKIACIVSYGYSLAATGTVFQNYCMSQNEGMALSGSWSSPGPTVRRNYVQAVNAGIRNEQLNLQLQNNIIVGGSPPINASSGTNLSVKEHLLRCSILS
jgi:hypothetical protein